MELNKYWKLFFIIVALFFAVGGFYNLFILKIGWAIFMFLAVIGLLFDWS